MIVKRRSCSFSIVRLAMTPGTPHPVAISIGMKDFPERPNFLKSRSMTKAILAIYPQSSRKLKHKNNIINCGRNPNTAPTPAMMPFKISSCIHPATCHSANNLPTCSGNHVPNNVSLIQSVPIVPTV